MITHAYLLSRLHYDSETGSFIWKDGPRAGRPAGCDNGEGYLVIKLKDKRYRAQRLAWFYVHSEWPKQTIDHRDRVRDNNKFSNLRDLSQRDNNRNRKVDVTYRGDRNRWRARISLGSFATRDEAVATCRAAFDVLWPDER